MKKCEVCHKEEVKKTIWLNPDQSPIKVGGRYQVCDLCAERSKKL